MISIKCLIINVFPLWMSIGWFFNHGYKSKFHCRSFMRNKWKTNCKKIKLHWLYWIPIVYIGHQIQKSIMFYLPRIHKQNLLNASKHPITPNKWQRPNKKMQSMKMVRTAWCRTNPNSNTLLAAPQFTLENFVLWDHLLSCFTIKG